MNKVKVAYFFTFGLFLVCLNVGAFGAAFLIFVVAVAPLGFRAGWRDADKRMNGRPGLLRRR